MQYVMMSRDRGDTWEKISPDLSYNNLKKIGDINYQTISSLSESPRRFGLIYAGTDDGRIWRTKNGGKKWVEIRSGKVPVKWVSRIVASKYDLGTVYMTQTGRRDDDFQVYIWKSKNFGKTWEDISGNIPVGPVNAIREDPKHKKRLYVATDAGVYITKDGGKKWNVLGKLPFAYVHDLKYHPRDNILIIATHGRGIWVLDAEQIDNAGKKKGKVGINASPEAVKNLLGNWTIESNRGFSFTLKLVKKGSAVSGTLSFQMGKAELSDIYFDGKQLLFKASFDIQGRVFDLKSEITIKDNKLKGSYQESDGEYRNHRTEREKKIDKIEPGSFWLNISCFFQKTCN